MYTHMINSSKNFLSLSHLLKNSFTDKMGDAVKEILDAETFDILYANENTRLYGATVSRIENGDRKAASHYYNTCASYLVCRKCEEFLLTCNEIAQNWTVRRSNLTACNADTGAEISIIEALKILINSDKDFGKSSALRDWLNDALRNGEKFLSKVLSVVTILAVTRGNWVNIEGKLNASGYLEKISDFPHYTDYDRLISTENLQTDTWNAYVCWRNKNFADACKYLATALESEQDNFCKERLLSWLREADEIFLTQLIANKDTEAVEEHLENLRDTQREWYGYACWLASEMFRILGDEDKRSKYLSLAVGLDEPHAICEQMKILLPTDTALSTDSDADLWLAEKLSQMQTFPQLRGEAYYRLYLYTGNEKFLRNAYRCGSPKEAVKKYLADKFSFSEKFVRADYSKPGRCILNIDRKNPIAQILAATIPESWQIYFAGEFGEVPRSDEILMYVFAKDAAAQNFNDFMNTLDALKDMPLPCAMFFIRGESEFLMPVVDTALHQWYSKDERSTIRVQILDDAKRSVQELFGRHPLFYGLWTKPKVDKALHLILVGEGKTVPWLLREASWLMTAVPRAKISLMSPHAESILEDLNQRYSFDEVKIQPFNVNESRLVDLDIIAQAVIDDDAVYFVVDTGDSDLKNAEVARRLREIYIRAWVKNGTTSEPLSAPIAVHCADLNVSSLLRRSIVFGIEHGESWYNSHKFICYGDLTRYTWKNLVSDIFERIGVSAHMIYSELQSVSAYLNALRDYARFTYNQDSSVAVAVSLPYRLYLLSRLDPKIIPSDWDITDGETFFAPENLQRFAQIDAVSKLEEFYNLLDSLHSELQRLWNRLQTPAVGETDKHWRSCIAAYRKELAALLDTLADTLEKINQREISLSYETLKDLFNELKKIRKADVADVVQIADAEFINLRDDLSAKIVTIQDEKIRPLRKSIEEIFAWEHARWNGFMLSRGWQTATVADAKKYIAAGNKKQQCYIAKIHPCIIPYARLDDLTKNLEPALGVRKPFKQNDITSISRTKDLLAEIFFSKAAESIRNLYGA